MTNLFNSIQINKFTKNLTNNVKNEMKKITITDKNK